MAHIDRENFCGTALQQTIGEAAGGSAEINRDEPAHVDSEVIECMIQLVPAAAEKPFGLVD